MQLLLIGLGHKSQNFLLIKLQNFYKGQEFGDKLREKTLFRIRDTPKALLSTYLGQSWKQKEGRVC